MLLIALAGASPAQGPPVAAVLRAADIDDIDVTALVVSQDGSRVLMHGPDGVVVLGPDGVRTARVELVDVGLASVAGDGRFVAMHQGGITTHAASGDEQLRLGAYGRVSSLALSPDGRWLAVGSDLALELHDAVDGRLVWSKDGVATGARFSADGSAVLATLGGKEVALSVGKGAKVSDAADVPVAGLYPGGCVDTACPCPGDPAFDRGDRLLALSGGHVERWQWLGEDAVARAVDGPVVAAAWAEDDVVAVLADGRLVRVGALPLEVAVPGCTETCSVAGVGGTADETWVVGPAGLQRWGADGVALLKKPQRTDATWVDRDGAWGSLAGGRVHLGDRPGGGAVLAEVDAAIGADVAGDVGLAWSSDRLVVGRLDGRATTPSLGPGRRPLVAALSPDGALVAIVDDLGALHVYRTEGGVVFRHPLGLHGASGPPPLAWSSDGTRIAVGGARVHLFDAVDGGAVSELHLGSPVHGLAVSASHRMMAVVDDGVVVVGLDRL